MADELLEVAKRLSGGFAPSDRLRALEGGRRVVNASSGAAGPYQILRSTWYDLARFVGWPTPRDAFVSWSRLTPQARADWVRMTEAGVGPGNERLAAVMAAIHSMRDARLLRARGWPVTFETRYACYNQGFAGFARMVAGARPRSFWVQSVEARRVILLACAQVLTHQRQ